MSEGERCVTHVSDYCMTMAKDPCLLSYLLMPPTESVPLAAAPRALCWGTQVGLCTSPATLQLYAFQTPGLEQTACLHTYKAAWDPSSEVVSFAPRSSSNIYTLASTHPHLWGPWDTGTQTQ